tara:strand:+ start:191 stop:541 length:351 start_codon:yes stop_codon:yes gene_type:complete
MNTLLIIAIVVAVASLPMILKKRSKKVKLYDPATKPPLDVIKPVNPDLEVIKPDLDGHKGTKGTGGIKPVKPIKIKQPWEEDDATEVDNIKPLPKDRIKTGPVRPFEDPFGPTHLK